MTKFHFLLSYRSREFLLQMNNEDRFQLLETILKGSPSEAAWDAVVELLASWPDNEEKEEAFDLANKGMESWSDDLRHVSSSWSSLYDKQSLSSTAKIVRFISIRRREQNGNQELIKISKSPFIKNLQSLVIERSVIYIEGITALVTSPYLTQLKSLSIHGLTLSNEEWGMLFGANNLPSLSALAITGTGLSHEMLGRLLQSDICEQLEKLDISYDSIDDEKASLISGAKKLHQVKYLNLSGNYLRNVGVKQIIERKFLKNLQELNLSNNKIDEETKSWINHYPDIHVIL